jgi:hypothetical protein
VSLLLRDDAGDRHEQLWRYGHGERHRYPKRAAGRRTTTTPCERKTVGDALDELGDEGEAPVCKPACSDGQGAKPGEEGLGLRLGLLLELGHLPHVHKVGTTRGLQRLCIDLAPNKFTSNNVEDYGVVVCANILPNAPTVQCTQARCWLVPSA